MKSFREIIKSPVRLGTRTKDSEALAHIETSILEKEFRKIVKQLGGKNVARQLLVSMNQVEVSHSFNQILIHTLKSLSLKMRKYTSMIFLH